MTYSVILTISLLDNDPSCFIRARTVDMKKCNEAICSMTDVQHGLNYGRERKREKERDCNVSNNVKF